MNKDLGRTPERWRPGGPPPPGARRLTVNMSAVLSMIEQMKANLTACQAQRDACQGQLTTCKSTDLPACQTQLNAAQQQNTACQTQLTTCKTTDLPACQTQLNTVRQQLTACQTPQLPLPKAARFLRIMHRPPFRVANGA